MSLRRRNDPASRMYCLRWSAGNSRVPELPQIGSHGRSTTGPREAFYGKHEMADLLTRAEELLGYGYQIQIFPPDRKDGDLLDVTAAAA